MQICNNWGWKNCIRTTKKIKVQYKSKNQPVTNADIEINNFLFDFFKKKTPNFGWLSEESLDDKSRFECDFFWCLDPIDGTRSYISGKPEYTISLALINNFQPILGIIYNPTTNEYFHAEKNKGAFCNNRQIKVNSKRLDEYDYQDIYLLKIDAEGHELEVLSGSEQLLNKIKFINDF